jgi:acetyltransferase-like isoleucine patch superfamily enzyme
MTQDLKENNKISEIEPLEFSYTFFVLLYFVMTWLGVFPSVVFGYWYFTFIPFSFTPLSLLLLIPLFFVLYGIALLSSLISTKIGIWIVHKRITYPKLGTYPISMKDPQAHAYFLKGNIKNFGRWLFYFFHLQFLRTFWMRQMGVKIGKNVRMVGRCVEDEDFIEIGDNTYMSSATAIGGHLMDRYITICKTVFGKNCIINYMAGGVGSTMGDNSILLPFTGAMKGQICRGNAIYQGMPCKKVGEYSDLSPAEIKEMKEKIAKLDKENFIKKKNATIRINEINLVLMKIIIIIGGCIFGLITPYLYYLFFTAYYSSDNHLLNMVLLIPIPFIFLIILGFFIAGTTIFTKILLVYYDRKAEIPEGYYELDDPKAKVFKMKYCLRRFGLRLFDVTPFKIVDTFALRLWGNTKIGKNVKLSDAIIDPQYLEVGDFSQIAQGSRVHTHDIIDGKLYVKTVKIGKKVLIGNFAHIKPGVEIADESIGGVMAWFRLNRICKRPALYIGKPIVELPIEFINRAARAKEKYVD